MKQPFFSIIIATYNSEETLKYTLESIAEQTIDVAEVETIIIDGGSSDDTLSIAKQYGAEILNNPYKLPEYAKAIGTEYAHGKYVIRMDSDEEFAYKNQLNDRMDFLIKNPNVKVLLPNRLISGNRGLCGMSADYMNTFGDPFSLFVYNTKIDKYDTYAANICDNDGRYAIMRFKRDDIYPLADSATTVLSLDYMREKFPNSYCDIDFTCGAIDRIIDSTELCACAKGDDVYHNCSSSIGVYLSKLRFRVVNNIFHKEESGFSAREGMSRKLRYRKILFCLYAAFIPAPIFDSFRLAIKYCNLTYVLHFVYLYYVCVQIAKFGLLKIVGRTADNKNYGK